jgi:hypothetical protein
MPRLRIANMDLCQPTPSGVGKESRMIYGFSRWVLRPVILSGAEPAAAGEAESKNPFC